MAARLHDQPPAHHWSDRKERYKSIAIDRRLSDLLKLCAHAEGISIATLVNRLCQSTVEEMARRVLERKLAGMGTETPARKRASAV